MCGCALLGSVRHDFSPLAIASHGIILRLVAELVVAACSD
jgi:hypothetical protein